MTGEQSAPRKSRKIRFLIGVVSILLLGIFLFVPKSAFRYCPSSKAIKDEAEAISVAMYLTRENDWANFEELGGTQGFLNLLQREPDCCAASTAFSWDYMTWIWGIDLKILSREPGFLVVVGINRCGRILQHGNLRLKER